MSGPLAGLFDALVSQMSARNEFSVFLDDAKRERILHGLVDSYYEDSDAEVIFDTNRSGPGAPVLGAGIARVPGTGRRGIARACKNQQSQPASTP